MIEKDVQTRQNDQVITEYIVIFFSVLQFRWNEDNLLWKENYIVGLGKAGKLNSGEKDRCCRL